MKRQMFYSNGEMIDYRLPQTFQQSKNKSACGNCGLYSNRHGFCGVYRTKGVKDTYVCNKWRQRHFKR